MKAVTIREAQGQLGELIAQACRGEFIVLTDGDKQVALEPRAVLGLEQDSPELEAELLKAVNGAHAPFRKVNCGSRRMRLCESTGRTARNDAGAASLG